MRVANIYGKMTRVKECRMMRGGGREGRGKKSQQSGKKKGKTVEGKNTSCSTN